MGPTGPMGIPNIILSPFRTEVSSTLRIAVASQDIGEGRISPNINITTQNLVRLRKPSFPFVLPNFIDIC